MLLPKFFPLKPQNPTKSELIDVGGVWNKYSFQEHYLFFSDDANENRIVFKSIVENLS